MCDILLTHSYFYPLDPKQWKNKNPFPPLGTIYAAAQLRALGYPVDLYDTNLRFNLDDFAETLSTIAPRFLVIYDDGFNYLTKMCLTNMRQAAFKMIDIAKSFGCTVLVSSSDATDHFEKYLKAGADYIIYGEGEQTVCELIQDLDNSPEKSIEEIQGIIYYQNESIRKNTARPVINNLDRLQQPAWDLIDIDSYRKVWTQSPHPFTLNIATTRGCPFKCNWCAKPIYGNRYNSHSPEYIVDQIKYHQEYHNVSSFWMCDDIFGLKPNWVQEFKRLLKLNNLEISYYMQSRVDLLLKEDTIEALAESGLKKVWLGAESGSQRILDAMDKGTTTEQIYEATKTLKRHGIEIAFFLQFGYPGEEWSDIRKTIKMVEDLIPDDIGVSVSYPLPGTPFYDRVKQELKLKSNWTDSDDLDLMFENTFKPGFYKILHRYIHSRYRIRRGIFALKSLISNTSSSFETIVRDISRMIFHIPKAIYHRTLLYKHQISK